MVIPHLDEDQDERSEQMQSSRRRGAFGSSGFELSFLSRVPAHRENMTAERAAVGSARLKLYHELCDQRLDCALNQFRRLEDAGERGSITSRRSRPSFGSSPTTTRASLDPRNWKLVRERSDIHVMRHMKRKQRTSTIMATGTLHGSLVDVMSGLYAESTNESRVLHALLTPRVLDTGVVLVDKRSSESSPFQFSGITYTALQAPGIFCRHRDFLCFKKMDLITDDFGEEFGYMTLQSVDSVDDPLNPRLSHASYDYSYQYTPQQHSPYRRGYLSIAIVFYRHPTDSNLVTMFAHGEYNPKGRIPLALGELCLADYLVSMAHTVRTGQAKKLSALLQIQHEQRRQFRHSWGPNDQDDYEAEKLQDRCSLCARSLFFWDGPRRCRSCWKRTCRRCRVEKPIFCAHMHRSHDDQKGSKIQSPCTENFCLQCVCNVIPSATQTNAKLLDRLDKKRRRSIGAPSNARQTISSSTDDVRSWPGRAESDRMMENNQDDASSISAFSSFESDKLQQHRLTLTKPPRRNSSWDQLPLQNSTRAASSSQLYQTTSFISNGGVSTSMQSFFSVSSSGLDHSTSFSGNNAALDETIDEEREANALHPQRNRRTPKRHDNNLPKKASGRVKASPQKRSEEYYDRKLQDYLNNLTSSHSFMSSKRSMDSSAHDLMSISTPHTLSRTTPRFDDDLTDLRGFATNVDDASPSSVASARVYAQNFPDN